MSMASFLETVERFKGGDFQPRPAPLADSAACFARLFFDRLPTPSARVQIFDEKHAAAAAEVECISIRRGQNRITEAFQVRIVSRVCVRVH
jgi:hypothetical protein